MVDSEIQWYHFLNRKFKNTEDHENDEDENDGLGIKEHWGHDDQDTYESGTISRTACLMDHYGGKYIIQKMGSYNGVSYRRYGELSGAVSILDLILQKPECCFFEVAMGSQPQKFRLDIDIPIGDPACVSFTVKEESRFLEECVDAIVSTGSMCGCDIVPSRDVYLFSSHGPDKRSYHLILCGFYFLDNEDCKTFYLHFMDKKRPNPLDKYIDDSVYSKVQCFRLLGCSKIGKKRTKILCKGWWYGGVYINQLTRATKKTKNGVTSINSVEIMEKSLLTYISDDIRVSVPDHVKLPKYNNQLTPTDSGSSRFTDELVELAKEKFEKWSDGSMEFFRVSDDMRFIFYKRVEPSFCNGCKRVHHAENGFIYLKNNSFIYDCRRGSKQVIDALPLSFILSAETGSGKGPSAKVGGSAKVAKILSPRDRFSLLRLGNKERIYNSDIGKYIYQDIASEGKRMVQRKISFGFSKEALEKKNRGF